MSRKMVCSLALGALALLVPAAGSAQTFVDVGVWTSGGGGRVVIGGAPVYRVPVYHAPVYRAPVYYRAPIYRPVYVAPAPVYVVQPYYGHRTTGDATRDGARRDADRTGPAMSTPTTIGTTAATIGVGANDESAPGSIRARTPRPDERARSTNVKIGPVIAGNSCQATSSPNVDAIGLVPNWRTLLASGSGTSALNTAAPSSGGSGSRLKMPRKHVLNQQHREQHRQEVGLAARSRDNRLEGHAVGRDERPQAEPHSQRHERGGRDHEIAGRSGRGHQRRAVRIAVRPVADRRERWPSRSPTPGSSRSAAAAPASRSARA